MQTHKWIRVYPMSSRRMATIHDDHVGIGFVEHGVRECHARGPGTHNQIISLMLDQSELRSPEAPDATPLR